MKMKCHVVPVAHHLSSCPDVEWRLSFSLAEKFLAHHLTKLQRQIYIFFKYILWKNLINKQSTLSSYHLKTTFFWLLEGLPLSLWSEENFAQIAHLLLDKLELFLSQNNLPNYFVSTNNMVYHLKVEDLHEIVINIRGVKEDILSQILSCPTKTSPLILDTVIFKKVFSPIFPFMQINKKLFDGKDVDDGEKIAKSDTFSDEQIQAAAIVREESGTVKNENEITKRLEIDEMESANGEIMGINENKTVEEGMEKRTKTKEDEKREMEDHLKQIPNLDNQSCDEEDEWELNEEEMLEEEMIEEDEDFLEGFSGEYSSENQSAVNFLFNRAKNRSLIALARIYQYFESFDFTVQILKELYDDSNQDDLTLPLFITDMSLSGATAEIEPIKNIIQMHEYLLTNIFQNNSSVQLALAHLHLCLSSVSQGIDKNKAIHTSLSYLDTMKEPSIEGDVLRARLEAERQQYDSALKLIARSYSIIKDIQGTSYVSINPIEYLLLLESFKDLMIIFADSPGGSTQVPTKLFVLFLNACYQNELGMKDGLELTRKEYQEQLKCADMDESDRELGQSMLSILVNFLQD